MFVLNICIVNYTDSSLHWNASLEKDFLNRRPIVKKDKFKNFLSNHKFWLSKFCDKDIYHI